jgi:hypothetical protein
LSFLRAPTADHDGRPMPPQAGRLSIARGWRFLLFRLSLLIVLISLFIVLLAFLLHDFGSSLNRLFARALSWIEHEQLIDSKVLLCLTGLFGVLVLRQLYEDLSQPYIVVDDSSISWASSIFWHVGRRYFPWSQIEACACKNEKSRRILRIFLRKAPDKTPPSAVEEDVTRSFLVRARAAARRMSKSRTIVDIDFGYAHEPEQSLDQAFQACAGHVAAAREPSEMGAAHPRVS